MFYSLLVINVCSRLHEQNASKQLTLFTIDYYNIYIELK